MADSESLLETVENLWRRRILFEVVAAQLLLHLVLHVERQSVLEQAGDLATILTVTVAHREKVAVLEAHNVRRRDIGILISLVWVVCRNTALGSERELRHNVADLVLGLAARLALLMTRLLRRGRIGRARGTAGLRLRRTCIVLYCGTGRAPSIVSRFSAGRLLVSSVWRAAVLPFLRLLHTQLLCSLHALQALSMRRILIVKTTNVYSLQRLTSHTDSAS